MPGHRDGRLDIELELAQGLQGVQLNDPLQVVVLHCPRQVLLIRKHYHGYFSLPEDRVLCHLHEDLLHDTEPLLVRRVHHKEYPVHVRVEKAPVLSVPTLNRSEIKLCPTYLAREVIDDAGDIIEGERDLLHVDVGRRRVVLVGALGDRLETLHQGRLACTVETHQEELFVLPLVDLLHFEF